MSAPLAVLVGPPGAGKSTVAALLAERLGSTWRDTDHDVEQRIGRSVGDIFVLDGEAQFRQWEHEAVLTALAEHTGVLALGGGAVLDPRTEQALQGHRVVFLDVRIADAAGRIGFNRDRPLLLGNPRARWTELMQQRRPVYERVAVVRVDTAARTVEQVVDEVQAALVQLAAQQHSQGE